MKQITISVKKIFIISFVFLLLIGGYFLWTYFTSPMGNQKVVFVAAKSENFTSGNLTYTVYRAENGVSDDVIYYLHGRNLDGSIWNDDTYFTALEIGRASCRERV